MTKRRSRLTRLEARRRKRDGDTVGTFEADLQAGEWREVEGGTGRTLPLSPEDLREAGSAGAAGGALLMLARVLGAKTCRTGWRQDAALCRVLGGEA